MLSSLLRDRVYTVTMIVIIAAAVAINGAVFSVLNAVLLRPLPITAPHELVVGWGTDPARGLPLVEFSYQNVSDWASRSRTLRSVGAMGSSTWPETLVGSGPPRRLWSAGVSGTFFQTLGVTPLMGRLLGPHDDVPGAARVAVISHRLWLTEFGGDRRIVGAGLRLADGVRTVVGVMPPAADLPRGTDLWIPVVPALTRGDASQGNLRHVGVLFLVGRLAAGSDMDGARRELDQLADRVERENGTPRFGTAVVLTSLPDMLFGPVRQVLWLAAGAVVFLAVIATTNVAMLLLARGLAGRSADAMRLALGATQGALTKRRVTEVLLLASGGGGLGALAALVITRALVALAPADVLRLDTVTTDWSVIGATLVISLLTLTCMAVGMSSFVARQTPADLLDDQSRQTAGRSPARVRAALVMVQIGCASLLLLVAVLLAQSLLALQDIDPGFDTAHAAVLKVVPEEGTDANAWLDSLTQRVATGPGQAAGVLYLRPLAHGAVGQEVGVRLHGQAADSTTARANPALNYQIAGEGTFRALGVPTRRGRTFLRTDDRQAPRVVVVGESTARRLWPAGDAVGQRMAIDGVPPDPPDQRWRTVIGVVGDVRYRGIRDVRLDVYDSALQAPTPATEVIVRGEGDPVAAARAVAATARSLDGDVLIDGVASLESIVDRALAPWTFGTTMLLVFAVAAVAIASGGTAAVVMFETAQARRELAIRSALGARPGVILGMIVGRTARRAAGGATGGVVAALIAAPHLRPLLVDVSPFSPWAHAAVLTTLVVVSVAAAAVPAVRAARTPPAEALRR